MTMKISNLVNIFFVGAALTLGSTGCAHHPDQRITRIPDPNRPIPTPPPEPTAPLNPGNTMPSPTDVQKTDVGISFGTNGPWSGVIANHNEDAAILKADTVYFDLDSATIKKAERANKLFGKLTAGSKTAVWTTGGKAAPTAKG